MYRNRVAIALCTGIMVLAAGLAQAASIVVNPGDSIQAAINAANPNDTILINPGTYSEQVVVNKAGLTLLGNGGIPVLNPALGGATYATVVKVQADNVTLKGLEITSSTGIQTNSGGSPIEQHGVWDGSWTVGASNLTVDGCVFHDVAHGVRSYGDNVVVTNNTMHRMALSGAYLSGPTGTPLSMTVKNNAIYDFAVYGKEGAGVFVKYDGRYGEVSYNYIAGMRMGLAYYYGGPTGGDLLFSHNTVDLSMDPANPVKMTMGMSFWGTGDNLDNLLIQDNLFANANWYALYQEGTGITGSFAVDNNLFYNNYQYYWPNYQYPYQWFGSESQAVAGWYSGPADGFTFTDNITAQDPMFVGGSIVPQEYWALNTGSPAYGTASDGTNIGAWQALSQDEPPIPEPMTLTMLAGAAAGLGGYLRKRRRC